MVAPQQPDAFIAIVDDEPLNVTLLRSALQRAGYTNIESFGNGEDALAALSCRLADVVLLDVCWSPESCCSPLQAGVWRGSVWAWKGQLLPVL